MPIQDFLNANSSSGQAPAALTIGVGADGKVLQPLAAAHALTSGHAGCCCACGAPPKISHVAQGLVAATSHSGCTALQADAVPAALC